VPELPEVETMRRGIAPVVGCRIADVSGARCRLRPIAIQPRLAAFRRRAVGRTIVGLGRVGKRVLVELDSADRIVLEPRMTGLVLLANPPDREHLRLRIALAGGRIAELLYWDSRGLGSVSLVSPADFVRRFGEEKLGPDALRLSSELLRERLGRSRRAIKVALLDQRAVAGIGNLYASEILHLCRLHPERRCDTFRRSDWQVLHAAIEKVLQAAIRYEGSTLADGTYRNALNERGGYQNHHRVYARAGEPCGTCGETSIVRIVQAQRSTFFCPACQRRSGRMRPR
jgi:formamidopyrimidine-DNA glycosylase